MAKSERENIAILNLAWCRRRKLHTKSHHLGTRGFEVLREYFKLIEESHRQKDGVKKCRAKDQKLWADGHLLLGEGDRLRTRGDRLWAEAILKVHGNIKMEWVESKDKYEHSCHLETGEVFRP